MTGQEIAVKTSFKDAIAGRSNVILGENKIIRDRSQIRNSAPTVQPNINTSSNEVNFASKEDWIGSLFHGATIKDNVININITNKISNQPPRK